MEWDLLRGESHADHAVLISVARPVFPGVFYSRVNLN